MSTILPRRSWSWLPRGFASTRWSLVRKIGQPDREGERAAEEISRIYWHPLYAFLRCQGHAEQDARDHVQSFLARALEKGWFTKARRERGRFRSYILKLLRHHVSSVNARAGAKKRGGGIASVSWEAVGADEKVVDSRQFAGLDPEAHFNRLLAINIFDEALADLHARYTHDAEDRLFEELLPALEGPLKVDSYAGVAARLGKSPNAVKVAANRLRNRFRVLLRQRAATALGRDPGPGLDDELRDIFG